MMDLLDILHPGSFALSGAHTHHANRSVKQKGRLCVKIRKSRYFGFEKFSRSFQLLSFCKKKQLDNDLIKFRQIIIILLRIHRRHLKSGRDKDNNWAFRNNFQNPNGEDSG